jgi:hypothetical protein
MNTEIKSSYNAYSIGIVLHLIRNNEKYRKLWIEKYPITENFVNNFVKDENCGCRPSIIKQYKKDRFAADLMTVNFINENKDFDIDEFAKTNPPQYLENAVFALPNTEAHYKDFLAALQQKNARFSHFTSIQIDDKIILTFF